MKAKVFKYKSDGNTVVAPYMELEPYAENVDLSLSRKNEYGNEDDDCFHVVCRIENVYFPAGSIHAGFSREKIAEKEAAPIAGTGLRIRFKVRKEESFVKFDLRSRVRGSRELDTTSLVQAREEYKRIQEQKRREREGERGGRAQSAGRATSAAAQ